MRGEQAVKVFSRLMLENKIPEATQFLTERQESGGIMSPDDDTGKPQGKTVMEVLLSKHRKDSKEESRQSSESACLSIWKRLLETMIKCIEDPHVGDKEKESEDLNVEHAQLLLFLFHSLQLMQKKAILLLCAQTLIRAAQAAFSIIPLHDTQLMLLARILLLLEYLIKNLYDAPVAMLEQIQWNLLSSAGLSSTGRSDDAQQPSRMFNCCRELEDSYRKYGSEDEGCCIRPRFYLLSNIDSNNQDLPKLGKFIQKLPFVSQSSNCEILC